MSPNASNTTSRRTRSDVRRSLFGQPLELNGKACAEQQRKQRKCLQLDGQRQDGFDGAVDRRCRRLGEKKLLEDRNAKYGHDVDRDDAEQGQAPQYVDGVDPLGGTCRPGRCGAIGHCNLVPVERRNEIRAPLYDSRISSSRRPSVLSIFFTALEAAISPWLA